MQVSEQYQKALYYLFYYISGWGGCDFSSTTRRDVIEGVLDDLLAAGLLSESTHTTGVKSVVSDFEEHPATQRLENFLNSMPREIDDDLGHINAFPWVKHGDVDAEQDSGGAAERRRTPQS